MPVPFRKTPLALAIGSVLIGGSPAYAFTPSAAGAPFEVKPDPPAPFANQNLPHVATDDNGNFVVVWEENGEVFFQLFAADGTPQGSDKLLPRFNANTSGRSEPTVAMDPNGDFVVVWQGYYPTGFGYYGNEIIFQRFDPAGTEVGSVERASTDPGGPPPTNQVNPAVAMDDDGDFVIAWEGYYGLADTSGITYRLFNAVGGSPFGPALANSTTAGPQLEAAVGRAGPLKDFVITWTDLGGADTDAAGVFAQQFVAGGGTFGNEFQVNQTFAGSQRTPSVDVDDDGDFAIAWRGEDGTGNGIIDYRVYAWDGSTVVGETNVAGPSSNQSYPADFPAVAIRRSNDVIVVWQSFDGDENGVLGHAFSPVGSSDGTFPVSEPNTENQRFATIAMDDSGDFVAAYQRFNQPDDDEDAYARLFNAPIPPVADAGPDQTVAISSSVTLDGTGSTDSDGTISSYSWTQTGGTVVSLTGANTATPSFTAPSSPDTLTFELQVTDDDGQTDTDTVTINAVAPPVADAGPDQTVAISTGVTLDGSGSTDSDGTITGYSWTQTGGTVVSLTGANTATPTFTAPSSADTLTFELQVTDDDGQTDTDTVTINAVAPPVADAGPDQTVAISTGVTLDGSGSTDSDGTITGYSWTQTGGTVVSLTGANTATPSFTAPSSADTLTFELQVTDDDGQTDTDTVTINVVRQVGLIEGTGGGPGSLGWLGALGLGLMAAVRKWCGRRRRRGGGVAGLLAGALALGALGGAPPVEAAEPVEAGYVDQLSGEVTAIRPGESARSLSRGDPVYTGDRVRTGAGARAILRLVDGTRVSLRASSDFRVAEIRQTRDEDGGTSFTGLFMDLLRGGLRMITGRIAERDRDNYEVRTPVATIGVRGTEFDARLCQRGECPETDEVIEPGPEPVARVIRLNGVVVAEGINAATRVLDTGTGIYLDDTVTTAADAWAVLRFTDGSKVSLQPDTEFRVDEWEFDRDEPGAGSALLNLLRGGIRVLTGLIGSEASDEYQIATPVATIGVRGTGFDLQCLGDCIDAAAEAVSSVQGDGLLVSTWDGEIFAQLENRVVEFATDQSGFLANATAAPLRLPEVPQLLRQLPAPRPDTVSGALQPEGVERLDTSVQDGTIVVQGAQGPPVVIGAGGAAVIGAGGGAQPLEAVPGSVGAGLGVPAATIAGAFGQLMLAQFDLGAWYAGGTAGTGISGSESEFEGRLQSDFPSASVKSLDNEAIATRVFGGFRLLGLLGVEVGYLDLGDLESEIDPGSASPSAVADDALDKHPFTPTGLDVSALVFAPGDLFGNTRAFGRAGLFAWEGEIETVTAGGQKFSKDVSGTDPLVGGGVEVRVGPNLHARAEWIRYELDPDPVDYVGAGLVWTFP